MWHSQLVRRALLPALGLGLALLALAPAPARAYDRQLGLSLELGYAVLPSGPLPPHGAYAEIGAALGLDDVWEIRVRAGYAFHPEPMHRWVYGAEIVYLVDIFEVVPFLGLGVAGITTFQDPTLTADFAVDGVFGLDVMLSREITLGVIVRPNVVLTALDTSPVWLEAGARLQGLFPL
ncbi:MAG: hypothetical protein U0234_03235 [Sandaracinus sp.]